MNIDLHTLSIVLTITAALQIAAILMQYTANRTYKGIGWWLAGYIFLTAGFAVIPLRETASLEKLSIIVTNFLQISGTLAICTGIKVFFDQKTRISFSILVLTVYIASITYFTYSDNNLTIRIAIYSLTVAAISFTNTHTLSVYKSSPITAAVNFLSALFFLQGILFLFRAADAVLSPGSGSLFAPTAVQVTTFIVSLVNINLGLTGFIILINQRLSEDSLESKEQFEMIFNTSPDAALISRMEDGLIVNINEGFTDMFGLNRNDTTGKSTSDIDVWASPSDRNHIREVLSKKGIFENFEVSFKDKHGNILSGLLSSKIITFHGIPHAISVLRDITLRKKIEDKLIRAIDEIMVQKENAEKAKAEKELLLKEVHHRIKNNMNTIVGLLSIQSDTLKDPSAIEALNDAGSRIRSMMMLYDKLYRSQGFVEISIREYLSPLIDEIAGNYPNSSSVQIEKNIDEFIINAETLFSLGIIVNELISNIMKYAFTERSEGKISVSASLNVHHVCIIIQDNGKGLPESVSIEDTPGFGLQLVGMLIKQIGGSIKIENNNGAVFIIEFDL